MTTKQDINSALAIVMAVSETIRELGSIPSGELYAQLMNQMSLESYNKIITTLKNTKLVSESNSHVLTWVGVKWR